MRESQGAKLSCRTLRSSAMAGCDVRVSHPAIFFELFSAKPNLLAKSMPISRARVRALSYNSDGGFAGFDLRGLTPINSHDSETLRCDGGRGCITASECRAVKTRREEWVNSGKKMGKLQTGLTGCISRRNVVSFAAFH